MANEIKIKIGIIGGTGLDNPDILTDRREIEVKNSYGSPSDVLIEGKIKNVDCVLLARHGRKHTIMPTNVNYRANIFALKEQGCTHIIVTNACGSLKEEIKPGDIVFPDQFIDRTTKRCSTFYDGQESSLKGVCHIPMHAPFCPVTTKVLIDVTEKLGIHYHKAGTIVVIEGPRYSTQAESHLYRSWNCDIIGMTTVPEVVLANELGLCYATIAMATDYDCWRCDEQMVCVDSVMETMKQNAHKATKILLDAIPAIAAKDWSTDLEKHKMARKTTKKGITTKHRSIKTVNRSFKLKEKSKNGAMLQKTLSLNLDNLPESVKKEIKIVAKKPLITCSICLDIIDQHSKKTTSCRHFFHEQCINEWCRRKNTCPLCRTKIDKILSQKQEVLDEMQDRNERVQELAYEVL